MDANESLRELQAKIQPVVEAAKKHVRFHAGDKVEISEPCEFEFVTHKGKGYVRLPQKVKTTVRKKKVKNESATN